VLRKTGSIAKGRYVRYLPRGLIDADLKRGGWVLKCNSTSVHLQDGRRHWRVLRRDCFIFVRNEGAMAISDRQQRKGIIRLLAEEALHQDARHRSDEDDEDEPPPQTSAPRIRANFT